MLSVLRSDRGSCVLIAVVDRLRGGVAGPVGDLTVKLWVPSVEVLIGGSFATVPLQLAIGLELPSSLQL